MLFYVRGRGRGGRVDIFSQLLCIDLQFFISYLAAPGPTLCHRLTYPMLIALFDTYLTQRLPGA